MSAAEDAERTRGAAPDRPADDGLEPAPAAGDAATPGDVGADDRGEAPASIEEALAAARALADDNWDRYLRAEADLDNLRRRTRRQVDEALRLQRRDLLLRVLPVVDNLERALAHGGSDPGTLLGGVEGTYRELVRVLTQAGVTAIDTDGAVFDPALHDAVSVVPAPGEVEERVVSVELPGYLLDGTLLRPARVVVGRPCDPPADCTDDA